MLCKPVQLFCDSLVWPWIMGFVSMFIILDPAWPKSDACMLTHSHILECVMSEQRKDILYQIICKNIFT